MMLLHYKCPECSEGDVELTLTELDTGLSAEVTDQSCGCSLSAAQRADFAITAAVYYYTAGSDERERAELDDD